MNTPRLRCIGQDRVVRLERRGHADRDRLLADAREPLREPALPQQEQHLLLDHPREEERAVELRAAPRAGSPRPGLAGRAAARGGRGIAIRIIFGRGPRRGKRGAPAGRARLDEGKSAREDDMGDREMLRHALATLAYRGGKAVAGAPDRFGDFKTEAAIRTPGQVLAHVGDLLDWSLALADGRHAWHDSTPVAWSEEVARLFAAPRAPRRAARVGRAPRVPPESSSFQVPIADALTHVGQITMLRRMFGRPCAARTTSWPTSRRDGSARSRPRLAGSSTDAAEAEALFRGERRTEAGRERPGAGRPLRGRTPRGRRSTASRRRRRRP